MSLFGTWISADNQAMRIIGIIGALIQTANSVPYIIMFVVDKNPSSTRNIERLIDWLLIDFKGTSTSLCLF